MSKDWLVLKQSKLDQLGFVFIACFGLFGCPALFDSDVQKDLDETLNPTREIGVGEPCWMGDPPTHPDGSYTLREYNINRPSRQADNAFCTEGTYCHPRNGCTPIPRTAESCEAIPIDATFDFCHDPDDVCYPSEPTGSDTEQSRLPD